MADRYFYRSGGINVGPISLTGLQQRVLRGDLKPGDQFSGPDGLWHDVSKLSTVSNPKATNPVSELTPRNSGLKDATPLQPTPPSAAKSSATNAQWFFQTTAGVVGPITTEQFMEAVQAGVVRPQTLIRLNDDQQWMQAVDIHSLEFPVSQSPETHHDTVPDLPDLDETLARSSSSLDMRKLVRECVSRQESRSPSRPPPRSSESRIRLNSMVSSGFVSIFSRIRELTIAFYELVLDFLGRIVTSRIVWGATLLILLILVIPKIPRPGISQHHAYSALDQIFTEFQDMRSRDVDPSVWDEFRQRTTATLAKITPQLKESANGRDPVSMSLLRISRDEMPRLISDYKESSRESENRIHASFWVVKSKFGPATPPSGSWDQWSILIVALDVIGVSAVIAYIGRTLWQRRAPTS